MISTLSLDNLLDDLRKDETIADHYRDAVSESVGDSLRQARNHAGMTQEAVARELGVDRSRVAQMESDEGNNLTLRSLHRYATAIKCDLDISFVSRSDRGVISKIFMLDDGVKLSFTAAKAPQLPDAVDTEVSEVETVNWLSLEDLQQAGAFWEGVSELGG